MIDVDGSFAVAVAFVAAAESTVYFEGFVERTVAFVVASVGVSNEKIVVFLVVDLVVAAAAVAVVDSDLNVAQTGNVDRLEYCVAE